MTLDAVIFKIEIIIDSEYNNNRGAKPTKIALIVQVNVYRLLMVRDINYSVGKFSRGFNSLLTKAEIRHTIIVKVEILSPNTLHNVRQRNIVRKPQGTGALIQSVPLL